MPKTLLTPAAQAEALQDRLAHLPRFYSYRDVLHGVYDGDEDAFVDGVCGDLPPAVREACLETMQPRTLETMLLRRIVRQLGQLLDRGIA